MNNLTLRTLTSPYGDITKNSVLTQAELDGNFITLKGETIASASTFGGIVSLVKYNGETISFSGGSGGGTGDVIVPISKFLIFKMGTGTPDQLEIGDMVQGIVENKKIEAIYLGGDTTLLSSFDVINFITLTPIEIFNTFILNFADITTTATNLGITDINNVADWNTVFEFRGVQFDSVIIEGNTAKLRKVDASLTTYVSLGNLELINFSVEGFELISTIDARENQIVNFNPIFKLPNSLEIFYLNDNQIVNFNPSIPFPDGFKFLNLTGNQIINFNPDNPFPIGFEQLTIAYNQIVNFNPSLALPDGFRELVLNGNQITSFNPVIPLPESTEFIDLSQNLISIFNPSNSNLINLNKVWIANNQITTSNWDVSAPWLSQVPNNGELSSGGNINSVSGTLTYTSLSAKSWSIS